MENSVAVAHEGDVRRVDGTAVGLKRLSLYWLATMYVAMTSFWGGLAAIQHASPLFDEVLRLGYPPHFSTLLGVWKVLGAMALTVPRRPLLKEWAVAAAHRIGREHRLSRLRQPRIGALAGHV